jgi:lysophospholipase L1-like esterase
VVTILIGINDAWVHHYRKNPNFTYFDAEYEALLLHTRQHSNATIVLCEPFILFGEQTGVVNKFGNFSAATQDLQARTRRLSDKHQTLWLPLQGAFDYAEQQYKGLQKWVHDGIHPTAAGHMIIAREWLKLMYSI